MSSAPDPRASYRADRTLPHRRFDDVETTMSHLFRAPHPALEGRRYGEALYDALEEGGWLRGYCPLCGGWPTLVEMRGLDRSRRLRCGRCNGDWQLPVLRCPYCDELRHHQLHALAPEGDEQTRRVDVCESCKGYIKTFTTLQAQPLRSLALLDLATLELDVMAQDRGYTRPSRPGYPLEVSLT